MGKGKIIIPIIVLGIATLIGWWMLRHADNTRTEPDTGTSTNTSDELQPVLFCGTEFYAEPVILFGVEMILRIAELATDFPETYVCANVQNNSPDRKGILDVEYRYIPSDASGTHHYLSIDSLMFSFNPETEEIFLHSGFDGTPTLFGYFR